MHPSNNLPLRFIAYAALLLAAALPLRSQAWLPDEPAMRASLAARATPPKTYFVSPSGNDKNDGLAPDRALRTPQRAADRTQPGDTVEFLNGTYTYDGGGRQLDITRSGQPDAYITYRAHPAHRPVFTATNGWDHIRVQAAYIILDGLIIEGNSRAISHKEAMANYESVANPPSGVAPDFQRIAYSNTNGISVDGRENRREGRPVPHHVIVRGCTVAYAPGGGINANEADYVLIENNLVHDNAHTMIFGGSGISVFHSMHIDTTMEDYKFIIRGNRVFRNRTDVPWISVRKISDGNGIIVDDFRNEQINAAPYVGRTLVANNIAYENGGSGIHAFSSDHVDIINNTVYANNQRPELQWGNLFVGHGADCLVLNNIIVATPGGVVNNNTANDRVIYAHNLYYDGKPAIVGPGDRVADPLFVDLAARDFRLRPDSPAIDRATTTQAPTSDYSGQARPQGTGIDIGAIESAHTSSEPLANAVLDIPAILKTFVFVPPSAEALPGTPVIDGQMEDLWKTTRKINALNVQKGGKLGPTGARGTTMALWDATHLYVLTEVTDAELSDAAKADYEQDSVEYFVDQNHARTPSYEADDGQYRANFKGKKSVGKNVTPEAYQAAATRTANGYIVEVAIPLKFIKPVVGTEIGFDVQINDGNSQGVRVSCVNWSDPDGSGYSRTSKYGRLLLTDRLREAAQNMEAPK